MPTTVSGQLLLLLLSSCLTLPYLFQVFADTSFGRTCLPTCSRFTALITPLPALLPPTALPCLAALTHTYPVYCSPLNQNLSFSTAGFLCLLTAVCPVPGTQRAHRFICMNSQDQGGRSPWPDCPDSGPIRLFLPAASFPQGCLGPCLCRPLPAPLPQCPPPGP